MSVELPFGHATMPIGAGSPKAGRDRMRSALAYLAAALMAIALAWVMTPRHRLAQERPIGNLEELVPKRFGPWRVDPSAAALPISPDVEQELGNLYSQIASRTYVDDDGYRVMLSIAYGGDQSHDLQVHRPEVCYVAQGFQLLGLYKDSLSVGTSRIPVMRMQSRLGARNEPVTYWVRIGDRLVRGNIEQGLARLRYGIDGRIADGLLFRVSSIDGNPAHAFGRQDAFVRDLLAALPADRAWTILGSLASR